LERFASPTDFGATRSASRRYSEAFGAPSGRGLAVRDDCTVISPKYPGGLRNGGVRVYFLDASETVIAESFAPPRRRGL
jgi:hypothetical protein